MRIGLFVLALLLVWLPIAGPIYWIWGEANFVALVTMPLLYGEFLFLTQAWGRLVYGHPRLLSRYGLEFSQRNFLDLLAGLTLGLGTVLALFGCMGLLGWLVWQPSRMPLVRLVPEALLMGLLIGLAEELLFRGWLLDELERDYRPGAALGINASAFALLHFIKPLAEIQRTWITFPALVLLGMTLVWAKRSHLRRDRLANVFSKDTHHGLLGLPIGLHGGLVWGYYLINVGHLVAYSGRVPPWVTGIDGNPLAGGLGLGFLGLLAGGMKLFSDWRQAEERQPTL